MILFINCDYSTNVSWIWRWILGVANKTHFIASYPKVAKNVASILLKRKRDEIVNVYELLKVVRLLAHCNDILLKCTTGSAPGLCCTHTPAFATGQWHLGFHNDKFVSLFANVPLFSTFNMPQLDTNSVKLSLVLLLLYLPRTSISLFGCSCSHCLYMLHMAGHPLVCSVTPNPWPPIFFCVSGAGGADT